MLSIHKQKYILCQSQALKPLPSGDSTQHVIPIRLNPTCVAPPFSSFVRGFQAAEDDWQCWREKPIQNLDMSGQYSALQTPVASTEVKAS